MPQCPSCNAQLDQDFGMVTCKKCQAVLLIDFSGQVKIGSEQIETEDVFETQSSQNKDSFDNKETSQVWDRLEDPLDVEGEGAFASEFSGSESFVENSMVEQESWEDPSPWESSSSDETSESVAFESENVTDEDLITSEDGVSISGFESGSDESIEEGESAPQIQNDEPMEWAESVASSGLPTAPDSEPLDVTSFANSEESNLKEGEYLYDLSVSGVDSKDLKEILRLTLADPKLKLSPLNLMKQIKSGRLLIPSLNPVKAKRIIEQLQYHDFMVTWRQRHVAIVSAVEEVEAGDDESVDVGDVL